MEGERKKIQESKYMRDGGRLNEECNGLGSEVDIYRWQVIIV